MKNFKYTINGNSYDVEIRNVDDNKAFIEVNGKIYEVEIQEKETQVVTPKFSTKPAAAKSNEDVAKSAIFGIKAPLPGVIIELHVKVGKTIKRGDKVMTMEAMKMHNDVLSEKDGVVKAIKVSAGDSVMEGDILVEIE
jgi:glutaconyl-CoA/methylmalonyl-CoA decarboxylase subunit gamma